MVRLWIGIAGVTAALIYGNACSSGFDSNVDGGSNNVISGDPNPPPNPPLDDTKNWYLNSENGTNQNGVWTASTYPDGKILLVSRSAVYRINSNFTTDLSFSEDGKIELGSATATSTVSRMIQASVVQPDSKALTGGIFYDNSRFSADTRRLEVTRYNLNGSLDETFGIAGKYFYPVPAGVTTLYNWQGIQGMKLLADGKVLYLASVVFNTGAPVGSTQSENVNKLELVVGRVTSAGTADTTFGNQGIVRIRFGLNLYPQFMKVQSDGSMLASGRAETLSGNQYFLARFNSNGSPSLDFGDAGIFLSDLEIRDFKTLPTNDILIVGNGSVLSLSADGTQVRPTLVQNLDLSKFGNVNKIYIGEINEFYVLGASMVAPLVDADVLVAKFNPDGTNDLSFGDNGYFKNDLGGNDFASRAIFSTYLLITGYAETAAYSGKGALALVKLSTAGIKQVP